MIFQGRKNSWRAFVNADVSMRMGLFGVRFPSLDWFAVDGGPVVWTFGVVTYTPDHVDVALAPAGRIDDALQAADGAVDVAGPNNDNEAVDGML